MRSFAAEQLMQAGLRRAAQRTGKMCEMPLVASREGCFRPAAVLSTDVLDTDPHGYIPVCKVHLRQAITRGLERAARTPAGYRVPIMVLPLDGVAL